MTDLTLKDHIKGQVNFLEYRQGNLWYRCETGFEFPVPVDDCGEASFKVEDKALLFMRYIRRHLQTVNDAPLIETCQMTDYMPLR